MFSPALPTSGAMFAGVPADVAGGHSSLRQCLYCASVGVPVQGARQGALWCFVVRRAVNGESVCMSFTKCNEPGSDIGPLPLEH